MRPDWIIVATAAMLPLLLVVLHEYKLRLFDVLRARSLLTQGKKAEALALLRGMTRRWSLRGATGRQPAQELLAAVLRGEGNYGEAAAAGREALRGSGGPGATAQARLMLSECLEGEGDAVGAVRERRLATEALSGAEPDLQSLWVESELLQLAGDMGSAAKKLEAALALISSANLEVRLDLMLQLARCLLDAGQPTSARNWAEAGLNEAKCPPWSLHFLGVLADAYAELGQLEEAMRLFQRALAESSSDRTGELRGLCLLSMGNLEISRGHLARAESLAAEALQVCPDNSYGNLTLRHGICAIMGQFEEALALLEQASRLPVLRPAQGRRQRLLVTCERASDLRHAAQLAEAEVECERAREEAASHPRLGPILRALAAELAALQGRTEDARRLYLEAVELLPGMEARSRSRQFCTVQLAEVAMALGDRSAAQLWLDEVREGPIEPINLPHHHELRGRVLELEGRTLEAMGAYQQAALSNYGNASEQRARDRLRELGSGTRQS